MTAPAGPEGPARTRRPRHSAVHLQGGRPPPRGGSAARRPPHRSKICCTAFRSATKTAAACSRSRRSSPGSAASFIGRILQLRPALDATSRLQDLRGAGRRRERGARASPGSTSRSCATCSRRPARGLLRAGRDARHGGLQLTNPQCEILDDEDGETIHTGRIVPVYERPAASRRRCSGGWCSTRCSDCPAGSARASPEDVARPAAAADRGTRRCSRRISRRTMRPLEALNRFATPAQQRLIFEEAFLLPGRASLARRHRAGRAQAGRAVASTIASASRRARVLPFKLTGGQKTALKEIVDDLQRPQPMNRLLQGDVGCGQDDRRAAGGARGDGERSAGGVHGADRDPGRAALLEHLAGCCRRRGSASRC